MATWTNVPNSSIETDKPVRAVDIRALRDNPIAIAGGAAGAPRIETNGINNLAVTTAKIANSNVTNAKLGNSSVSAAKLVSSERMTTGNVLGQTAGLSAGGVGSYGFFEGGGVLTLGQTTAGSNLTPSNTDTFDATGSVVGTWRCLGRQVPGAATVFLRIS